MSTNRFLPLLFLVAVCFGAGLQVARASGCDQNYCIWDTTGCWKTGQTITQLCCKDFDHDGQFHCVTCKRDIYECGFFYKGAGHAYDCQNPGELCF